MVQLPANSRWSGAAAQLRQIDSSAVTPTMASSDAAWDQIHHLSQFFPPPVTVCRDGGTGIIMGWASGLMVAIDGMGRVSKERPRRI